MTQDEMLMVAIRAREIADAYGGYFGDRDLDEALASLRQAAEEDGQGLKLRQAVPDGTSPDEEVEWTVLPTDAEWERIAEMAKDKSRGSWPRP